MSFATITWPDGTVWPPGPDPTVQGDQTPDFAPLADFGVNLASCEVDDAVVAALYKWMPTYLAYIERTRSLPFKLARPKAYASTLTDAEFPDRSLPAVFAATARTAEANVVGNEGVYETTWLVAVSCVVRGPNPAATRRLASFYDLAARLALVQQGDLDGLADETRWVTGGEARPLAVPDTGRYLAEGASQFHVFTSGSVQDGLGPTVPSEEPYGDLPLVDVVDMEFQVVPEQPTEEEPS